MPDKQKITVPADNYGRVYIGLLETELSAHAKLCYGVMWSFGPESWASVPSIARRMSVSENTVRKAQSELAAEGWIVEGHASPGATRHWIMVPPAQLEQGCPWPPHLVEGALDLKGGGSGGEPLPPHNVKGGVHRMKTKKESKQEGNQELNQGGGAVKDDPLEKVRPFTNYFKDKYEAKHKAPFGAPRHHFIRLAEFLKDNVVTLEDWKRRVDNYFTDPYVTSHSIYGLMEKWSDMANRRQTLDERKNEAANAAKRRATEADLRKLLHNQGAA